MRMPEEIAQLFVLPDFSRSAVAIFDEIDSCNIA
jgi:hypothetical protein